MARKKRGDFLTKQSNTHGTRWGRRAMMGLAAVIGCVFLALGVGFICLTSWLQGEGFREKVGSYMQKLTHAQQVTIPENMQVNGNKLTLPRITLRKAKFFEELSIGKLHVGVDRLALLKRILRMKQFSAEELKLVIRADGSAQGTSDVSKDSASRGAKQEESQNVASRPAQAPYPFFKNVQAHSFEVHYADTSLIYANREYGLTGYRLVATPYPKGGKDAWTLSIENGRVVSPFSWLRESGVKTATIRLTGGDVRLDTCRILLSPGNISAKASYKLDTGLWKAHIDVQRANVERVLKKDWRKKLTGALVGYIDFSGQAQREWEAHGELRLEDGVLEGLPLLSELKLHGTTPYRTLQIEKAACTLRFPYTDAQHNVHRAWLWDNVELRTRGDLFILRGRVITGQDGSLSGTLRIGVPQQMLAELGLEHTPPAIQLFNAPIELPGYAWLHVNLSGTLDDPHEDLSVRLSTVLRQSISSLPGTAVQSLQKVLGNLVPTARTPDPDVQQGGAEPPPDSASKQPVQKASEMIKKGLDLLF